MKTENDKRIRGTKYLTKRENFFRVWKQKQQKYMKTTQLKDEFDAQKHHTNEKIR